MVSTAGPSRTMRPRRSSALTANGRMVSWSPVWAGARTGIAKSGSGIALNIGDGRAMGRPRPIRKLAARPQAPGQNSLLRVQPVFGLVEYHGLRTVHHLVGDLFAAMCRQAVHEDGVRLGARH